MGLLLTPNMTDISPLVSVIIPTYNRGQVIRRALHSVLHQTYQNLEVIVVDDGSTDDTGEIVKSFADSRVRYIRHDAKKGAPSARNTGINAARTEFIAFQDSDDEWLCDKLGKQIDAFSKAGSEVGVVYTGFLRLENNLPTYYPSGNADMLSGNILVPLLHGNFIAMPSVLIKRECFIKVGLFDENLPRLQDWELFIRIAEHYKFVCINEPLLMAFYSPISITGDRSRLPIALKIILNKHHDLFSRNRKILMRHAAFLWLGKYQEFARRFFVKNPRLKRFMKALFD